MHLPPGKSAFLWGPRKSGKSTYLREHFPQSLRYDFLQTDLFFEISKRPALLRERLLAQHTDLLRHPIILDEVQKIPQVLDEVHYLIENHGLSFILCGSSARKLKKGQANLLGGRAWKYHLHPLTSEELQASGHEIDLLRVLNHGLVPSHYLEDAYRKSVQAYVYDYLKEEILAEGLARNVPAFSKFLDVVAFSHGEMVNYSNIARDSGVSSKTIQEYFHILEDTLLGHFVRPYTHTHRRDVLSKAPKFYLFDVGVAGVLCKRRIEEAKGPEFGRAFEHWIFMELLAYRSYTEGEFSIRYWRTKTGLEVDFILGEGEVAVEVKGSSRLDRSDFKGLEDFRQDASPRMSIMVCNEPEPRRSGEVDVLPWKEFLGRLWAGKIIR